MVCLPVIDSPDVFYSQDSEMNWDVIFLMLGMMMIVSILRETGVFELAAIWAAKRANGSPLRIMILLMVVTAFASAILPNVVSVLLIAPVTLLVCDRLDIGAHQALSFNAFLVNMAPVVVIILLVRIAMAPLLFRGFSTVDPDRIADVMSLKSMRSSRIGAAHQVRRRHARGADRVGRFTDDPYRAVARRAAGRRHPHPGVSARTA
jgi:Na+/H+ antiporter NhaD/arsenite permease-like protein